MKFEITQGCTAYGFSVDGKPYKNLSIEEKSKIIDYTLAKAKEHILNNHMAFEGIMEHFQYDSYEIGPTCDQCGDSVSKTIINI